MYLRFKLTSLSEIPSSSPLLYPLIVVVASSALLSSFRFQPVTHLTDLLLRSYLQDVPRYL